MELDCDILVMVIIRQAAVRRDFNDIARHGIVYRHRLFLNSGSGSSDSVQAKWSQWFQAEHGSQDHLRGSP